MANVAKPSVPIAQRLQRFDRRWIFLAMGLAIILPFFFPLGLPIKVSPMTKATFDTIESLQEGDVVYMSLDLDPASTAELEPFFRAVVLQLKRKGVKIAFGSLWYSAPPLIQRWMAEVLERPIIAAGGEAGYSGKPDRAYVKNIDYVYLGFREGKQAAIQNLGSDLIATFDGKAVDGTPIAQIPFMNGIKQLKDFKLMILVSAGAPGAKEYVQYVQSTYDLRMVAACTSVSTTDLSPYTQSGQLLGLVGGMAAVAQYETLVGRPATAAQGADVLNIGHLMVIAAIIFGNVIFFLGRRRRGGAPSAAPASSGGAA